MKSKKLKILNTLGIHFAPKAKQILDGIGETEYREITHKELFKIADKYDIIFVGLYPMIDKEVIDKAKKLKYIAIPANTLENIDVEYAESKGIQVISLWGETEFLNTITGTAELALGLLIDVVRLTPWAFDNVKKYKWERENFRGHNLYGKTLGIVGMGRLGTWMARYGKALGMNILCHDPHINWRTSDVRQLGKKVEFSKLLETSDIISIHAHLNKGTENMFNARVFKKMKKTAYLINTARGRIVNESALLKALENKEIAGYAADVLADEFETDVSLKGYPLVEYAKTHRNVIIVPHTGGMTHESRENTDIFIAEKLKKIIDNRY
ncbi:MAG: NAD(P)-dependent oxidoreductase [bacterium]|nr:NAD(P)-dependent oxidoreductase [bacterium]